MEKVFDEVIAFLYTIYVSNYINRTHRDRLFYLILTTSLLLIYSPLKLLYKT